MHGRLTFDPSNEDDLTEGTHMPTRLEMSGHPPRSHPNEIQYVDPASTPILLLAKRIQYEQILAPNWTWHDARDHTAIYMNHAQIFRDAYGTNDPDTRHREILKIEKGAEHALGIERAFLFGERKIFRHAEPGGVRRYTGGLLGYGAAIEGSTGGEPTSHEIETWAERALGRLIITGAWMQSYVDQAAGDQLRSVPMGLTFGIPTVQWFEDFGTSTFIKHRLLTGPVQWIAFYPRHLGYRYLQGRDTRHIEHTWEELHAGIDGEIPPEPEGWMQDEYITEAGLEFAEPGNIQVLKR